ncbi:MAG: hypothetical protein WC686_01765 [Candidatus Shapirobacteria bacterium]|jgi:hypothetical protein
MDLTDNIRSSEISIREFIENYYKCLKSGKENFLSQFFDSYKKVSPSIHKDLNHHKLDIGVLFYTINRLPPDIFETNKVVLAATSAGFEKAGYFIDAGLKTGLWRKSFPAFRRRKTYFHSPSGTLAGYITSPSDIDDFLNCLISFQIEWQKLASFLHNNVEEFLARQNYQLLGLNEVEWLSFKKLLGDNWKSIIMSCSRNVDLSVKLVEGDKTLFAQLATDWWQEISGKSFIFGLENIPIYVISSNLHSLVNIIGGYVRRKQSEIFNYTEHNFPDLYQEWLRVNQAGDQVRLSDFLYYISGKYFQYNPQDLQAKKNYEQGLGIKQIHLQGNLYCDVQIIPVKSILKSNSIDPYIKVQCPELLNNSQSLILNIDYPLGASAYYLFSLLSQTLKNIRGFYIIGKSAILSGEVGDVQIPSIIFDERSGNIFHINNVFNQEFPFPTFQSAILQNQKAISVYSSFMENRFQLEGYIDAGFNIIEMEAGPYLTAIVENFLKPESLQSNVFHLQNLPFDFGIINYASDNPLSKTMAEGPMALRGAEPTYLALLATLQHIIDLECRQPSVK